MTPIASASNQTAQRALRASPRVAVVVFMAFFVIGMALPVLPLHVRGRCGRRVPCAFAAISADA